MPEGELVGPMDARPRMRYGPGVSRAHLRRSKKTPHGRSPTTGRRTPESELVATARQAVATGDPMDLFILGSTLLSLTDPRRHQFERGAAGPPSSADLIEGLANSHDSAAVALALLIANLADKQDTVRQIIGRPRVAGRDLPDWLVSLDPVSITEALEMREALGDAENLVIRISTGGGYEFGLMALIDHNLRGALSDGFVINQDWASIKKTYLRFGHDPDVKVQAISAGDACARIAGANVHGDRIYPPLTSDTWPACQPLLEWALRHAPAGGSVPSYPEWSESDREILKGKFLASEFAAGFEDDDVLLFDSILWFATDYGPGDPYRWSPTSVEILLLDWLPRKLMAEVDYLDRAPRVLDSFVRFCHLERKVRPGLTAETVDTIDALAYEYHRLIRTDRPKGPLAVMAQTGWYQHRAEPWEPNETDVWRMFSLATRSELAHQVGGHHVLARLDLTPLTPPPDPWAAIPEDVLPVVQEIDDLCQRCTRELFDAEIGWACRILLTDIARADAGVLTRGRKETAAAAICWIVGKANQAIYQFQGVAVKDLLAWFGVKGPVAGRARPMLKTIGIDPDSLTFRGSLGTIRYLTSIRRQAILARLARLQS